MDHLRAYAARALVISRYEPSYFSVHLYLMSPQISDVCIAKQIGYTYPSLLTYSPMVLHIPASKYGPLSALKQTGAVVR